MTKKDYVKLAECVKRVDTSMSKFESVLTRKLATSFLVVELMNTFQEDKESFSKEKFLKYLIDTLILQLDFEYCDYEK